MSIAISEEHRALAQTVAGLLTKHQARAAARDLLDAETEPLPAFWAELGGQGAEPLGPPGGGDDPVPAGGEPAGGRGAEAGAGAGDEYSPHGMTVANKRRAPGVSYQVPTRDCDHRTP